METPALTQAARAINNSKAPNPPNPPDSRRAQKERIRATRACDRCKEKKMKCTGTHPCENCVNARPAAAECTWNSRYLRGIPPQIPLNSSVPRDYSPSPNNPNDASPFQRGRPPNSLMRSSSRPILPRPGSYPAAAGSSSASAHRTQQIAYTPYLVTTANTIFNAGDAPMSRINAGHLLELPPRDVIEEMVSTYFENEAPPMALLHQPSIERWVDALLDPSRTMYEGEQYRSHRAVVFMIFAQSVGYMEDEEAHHGIDNGMRWYQFATQQLQEETGDIHITSIQARLLQCFFLLSRGRINQCWSIFGSIVTLIYALGIHRKLDNEGVTNTITVELQKRAYWTAFILDKHLAYTLNRPQYFHSFDNDQELPKLVNDRQLTENGAVSLGEDEICPLLVANLHSELSVILRRILVGLYGAKQSHDVYRLLALVQSYQQDLDTWRTKASVVMDAEEGTVGESQENQCIASIILAHQNAIILLYRPFLLIQKPAASVHNSIDPMHQPNNAGLVKEWPKKQVDDYVSMLLEACVVVLNIQAKLHQDCPFFKALWFAHHCAFLAIAAIYVSAYQNYDQPTPRDAFFKRGQASHALLVGCAEEGSFIGRCVDVLSELEKEILAKIERFEGRGDEGGEMANEGADEGVVSDDEGGVMKRVRRWGFAGLIR